MPVSTTTDDLLSVARQHAADPASWGLTPQFDARERWYGRLTLAEDHEVWLLTWLPGQGTDLHDHGGSAGAFTVVSGEIVEQTLRHTGQGTELAAKRMPEGTGRRFGAHHVHRVVNTGTVPAITVHVYGPALRAMTRYRLIDGRLDVESITKAGADW